MKMNTKMPWKFLCLALTALLIAGCFAGCGKDDAKKPEAAEPVTLVIAGAWEDCKAIDAVGREFTAQYPECTVQYEYLQDYDAALPKRMTGDDHADMFFTNNLQANSAMLPYAFDFYSSSIVDLSNTFDGLIENFEFFGESKDEAKKLYAIPTGAELRGIFVNKTLLASLNIPVPTDQASLISACETLKQNGYIAFHGNPGSFAQALMYPWICNTIANAEDKQAAYDKVNSREAGLSEMFKEPFGFLYMLVENGYYDYKRAQTDLNLFIDSSNLGYSLDFFNIRNNGETWEKADDIGQVAFMASPMSLNGIMAKTKDDYHSQIDYEFMLAPLGTDGGFAYLSPGRGIAVNKDSANLEWCEKFINFLFTPEYNEICAEEFGIMPNTKEVYDYIGTLFDIPDNRISQLGEVTFDYLFYDVIVDTMVDISKANNPKYMIANEDGTTSLYPLTYYTDAFEEAIAQYEQ